MKLVTCLVLAKCRELTINKNAMSYEQNQTIWIIKSIRYGCNMRCTSRMWTTDFTLGNIRTYVQCVNYRPKINHL